MILYFADRKMNVLGNASTSLPDGFIISDDDKLEEVETGVATFQCEIGYDDESRIKLENMTAAGNYLLRHHNGQGEFYTIVETEEDTKDRMISIYAEDAGMDLLNAVAGAYTVTSAQTIDYYINLYIADSGFEIGLNEVPGVTRILSWDGEATVTERLASIATQFGGYEISYSFQISGLSDVKKYVNIHKKRGKDLGVQLRLNDEIDRIVTKSSVADLATALEVTGGTPEGSDTPITLKGYAYDDGDFYILGTQLRSREAAKKWGMYANPKQYPDYEGHLIQQYSYDTTSQSELCSRALTKLKSICDLAVNYEVDINRLPDDVGIGDRIKIVDEQGKVYIETRILKLETSITNHTQKATLGESLLVSSGISQKVQELAESFSKVANLRTLYTWIAYADDEEGNGISLNSDGKDYVGIAVNRFSAEADISDPSIYSWSVILKGDYTLTITTERTSDNITMTAILTNAGNDVTSLFPSTDFKWYLIREGLVDSVYGSGPVLTVAQADVDLAGNVFRCVFDDGSVTE